MITVLKATNHVSQNQVFCFCQVQLFQLYLETKLLRDFYCPLFYQEEFRNVFRYVLSRLYIDCSPVSSLFVIILTGFFLFFCNEKIYVIKVPLIVMGTSNTVFMQRVFLQSVAIFENCQWHTIFSKLDLNVFLIRENQSTRLIKI